MNKDIILFDKKENCCGCWACSNICPQKAIKMYEDAEGFLFPSINLDLCVSCRLCEQVCPMKKRKALSEQKQNQPHVKIINFSMDDNYGAVIAGACLENAVKSIVSDHNIVETITYDASYTKPSFKKKLYAEKTAWVDLFKVFLRKIHLISAEQKEPEPNPFKRVVSTSPLRNHRYNRFRCNFLNMTKPENDITLSECRDNIKALICGSDIVWHPNLIKRNQAKAFYLNFGNENARRISYAASLDCFNDETLYEHKSEYKKRLKSFDYISVREQCNVDFISSVSKKDVSLCCDPVFLFDKNFFNSMISSSEEPITNDKYIYVYILSHNEKIAEYATRIAKEKNLKILFYSESQNDFGEYGINCSADGPAEFLQRIKNAEYVITTSFHCVAFSLLFEKKFIAFRRSGMGPKIDNILSIVGLTERLIEDNSVFDIDELIDFSKVRSALLQERKRSMEFLKKSLEKI